MLNSLALDYLQFYLRIPCYGTVDCFPNRAGNLFDFQTRKELELLGSGLVAQPFQVVRLHRKVLSFCMSTP